MCVCVCALHCVQFFATPWTVAYHTPLSMGFPRQEYWSTISYIYILNIIINIKIWLYVFHVIGNELIIRKEFL